MQTIILKLLELPTQIILDTLTKYKLIVDHSPSAIFLSRPDGTILEANKAACDLFGYTEQELKQIGRMGIIDHTEQVVQRKLEERRNRGRSQGEITGIKKGGIKFPIEFSSVIFSIGDGVEIASTTIHDISHRKKVEEQLIKSEQRFKSLVQDGSDLIGILDLSGNYIYVSPTSINVLGFHPESFIGKNAFTFIHEDDVESVTNAFNKLADEKRITIGPFRFKHNDGSWRWLETTVVNLLDEPAVEGIVANSRDVTEKMAAFKSMHESYERYRFVTNVTEDAIWDWDMLTDTIFWGEGFQTMFGFDLATLEGKSTFWTDRIHPDDVDRVTESINRVIKGRENNWNEEYRYKNGKGLYVFVMDRGIVLRDSMGNALRMVGAMRDISRQKNEALQNEVLAEIGQLFSNPTADLHHICNEVADLIRKFTKDKLVEIWLLNPDKKKLSLFTMVMDDAALQRFYHETIKFRSFEKGVGLPGVVWEQQSIQRWENIAAHQKFERSEAAQLTELQAVVGVPLIYGIEFIGVLVLGSVKRFADERTVHPIFYGFAEKLAAEIRRKQLENELSLIFNTCPDAICIAGPNGFFTKVNPAFCKLLGYSAQELTERPFTDFLYSEDQRATVLEYKETIDGRRDAQGFVNRYVTKSGDVKWISWNSSPFLGEDGHTFAYGRDVTDTKQLQDLLNAANRMARIGGWEVNFETETVILSDITREIHEVDSDYIPTLESGINFYREDLRHVVEECIRLAIQEGKPWDFELPIITAKGNERWVRSIGKAEIENGKCKKLLGSFQDIHERKVIELRLLNTSNNIPGIIFQYVYLPDGSDKILNLTKQVEEIWGYTAEQCMENIDLIWDQIRKGGDYEVVIESIKKSSATFERWHCEFRSIKPSGKVIWLEGFGTPSKLQNGAILWDSVVIDITQRKKLEYLVERSGKMARIGSWELDLLREGSDGFYWSSMTRDILEVDEDYVPTLSKALDFCIGESRSKIETALQQLTDTGQDFDLDLLIFTAKGNERWVRCMGQAEQVDNVVVKIFGSFQDIHAQKIAEENSLKALKEKNAILESISDAFIAVNPHWIITYWNKEAERILGKSKSEVLGRNLWDIYADAIDSIFYHKYHTAIAEGQPVHFEAKYDSLNMWFEISAYPSAGGLSVYFKDVTERKSTEQQILKMNAELTIQAKQLTLSNAELEQFAYVASHDLQEPLRMVSSFLTQLEKNYKAQLDERAVQYIHFAVDGARRMRQIILDLLDYSRIGRLKEQKETINLNELVEELRSLYRSQMEENKAELLVDTLPSLFSYKAPIRQVLHNIFSNALKYHSHNQPPRIKIEVSEDDEQWIFSIADNGIGIHKDYHDKIFVIFQRLHARNDYPGTGMGLTICKKIVENLGGSIWVDSAEGKGSTFYFTIRKHAEA